MGRGHTPLHPAHHLLRHRKAHGHLCGHGRSRTAFAPLPHRQAHLVLHIVVEVANGTHAALLVDGLLDLGRHRHVFQNETGNLQTVLLAHGRVDDGQERLTHLGIAAGHVQHWHVGTRQRIGEHAHDARTHRVLEFVQPEMLVGTRHFLQEQRRINNAEIISTKGPQPHHAKIRVPHHHRIGRAPLVSREESRVQVVDITLERRLETVFPAQDGGQDRNVLGGERVLAGAEQIGKLPGRHELHQLRFADDQLCTVLDLLVLIRPAKRQRVTRVVRPFDDIDELVADDVEQSVHARSPSWAGRRCLRRHHCSGRSGTVRKYTHHTAAAPGPWQPGCLAASRHHASSRPAMQ